jgi:hypothetical protein
LVNNKPAEGAFVQFVPANAAPGSQDPRPHATVGKDGSFQLGTYEEADGAQAGEYVVIINWPGGVLPDGREEPEDKLHGRYADPARSKLRVTVKEGPNDLAPFNLK